MMPVMAYNLLQSIELLASASNNFAAKCIEGIKANEERCKSLIEESLAMCTALAPAIGYEAAAKLAKERAAILRRWADLMIENLDDLATIMTLEQGKPFSESQSEIKYAAGFFEWFAEEGKRVYGDVIPSPFNNSRILTIKQPVGVCAAITPWNFPMAIPSWKMMPALICGNTLVIKPAEDTPLSTINLVKAAEEAGIPPGVINIVMGTGEDTGAPLTTHRDIRLVSFTGSTETGRIVSTNAAQHGKICSLEMGGKNVILVMDDADIELAAEGTVWGAFGTSGQRCTASSRVVVHKRVYKTCKV